MTLLAISDIMRSMTTNATDIIPSKSQLKKELFELDGPLLLLAGPGTGKTYNLGKRIKYLIEEKGVPSESITVITFTAAAAASMKSKIADSVKKELYIPHEKHPRNICTMHSLGFKILREKHEDLGLSKDINVVYSDKQQMILLEDASQIIGHNRLNGMKAGECRKKGFGENLDPENQAICNKYEEILRSCSAIDYDDQILLACQILKDNPEILLKYQEQCKHLLVDEYQDINASQFELIKLLTNGQKDGLFVVGDDDQSIYSWRGGSPEYIRNFKTHFGEGSSMRPLLKSFRCHSHILEGAIEVVKKFDGGHRHKGTFDYNMPAGKKIEIHNTASDQKEAALVKAIVKRVVPLESVLILIPHKGFSKAIIKELKKAGIKFTAPQSLPGEGLPIISTSHKWLKNESDNLSLRECIERMIDNPRSGVPSRKVRKPEKLKIREEAYQEICNLWIAVLSGEKANLWESLKANKDHNKFLNNLYTILNELRQLYSSNDSPEKLMSLVIQHLSSWDKTTPMLEEIDLWLEIAEGHKYSMQGSGVEIMTFQGAKGLEADVVCVIGLEEGTLPRNSSSPEQIAEQSRLMLVSMTRAEKELHLLHARNRSAQVVFRPVHQKGKSPDISPSKFLDAIPTQHMEKTYHP